MAPDPRLGQGGHMRQVEKQERILERAYTYMFGKSPCWEVSLCTSSNGGEKRGVTSFHPDMECLLRQLDADPHSLGTRGPVHVSCLRK